MNLILKPFGFFFLQLLLISAAQAGQSAQIETHTWSRKVIVDGKEANRPIFKGHFEISDLMKSDPIAY